MQLGTIPGVIGPDGATVGFAKAGKMLAELGSGAASKDTIEKWNQMHRIGLFEGDSQLVPDSAIQGVGKILDKEAFAGIKGADRYMRVVTY